MATFTVCLFHHSLKNKNGKENEADSLAAAAAAPQLAGDQK